MPRIKEQLKHLKQNNLNKRVEPNVRAMKRKMQRELFETKNICLNPESSTFGAHVNDPIERIRHRHAVRRELLISLPADEGMSFSLHMIKADKQKEDFLYQLEKKGVIIHKGNI